MYNNAALGIHNTSLNWVTKFIIHILKLFLAKKISSWEVCVCVFGQSTGQTDWSYAVNSEDPEQFLRFQVNLLHNQKKNSIWMQQCIFQQSAELSLTAGYSYERILMLPDSQMISWA